MSEGGLPISELAAAFVSKIGMPLPEGMLPTWPLDRFDKAALLFGSRVAREVGPFVLQGDLGRFLEAAPEGYLLVGFWGHGVQSHAFYYARVDVTSRVYFRLPYGGVYMDNERAAAQIRAFLERYFAVERELLPRCASLVAIDAMGEARYRLLGKDGTKLSFDESQLGAPSFEDRFAPLLARR